MCLKSSPISQLRHLSEAYTRNLGSIHSHAETSYSSETVHFLGLTPFASQSPCLSEGVLSAVMAKLLPAVKPVAQKIANEIDASLESAADNFKNI